MKTITRKIDQWILIGTDIRMSPTDIDSKTVRLVGRGRLLGGPNDGKTFDVVHELTAGQSCHFGPHVAVTAVDIRGDIVRLGVMVPAHIEVVAKEKVDEAHGS